jgi:threonylcarbamoyladenosine tRNA methylthiotransferase MtaB
MSLSVAGASAPVRYALLTFGCRVNQAESLAIDGALRATGGHPSDPSDAELVVVNSCSVTASADQGTRQAIRKIARQNPGARIVVTGCYATRRPGELAPLPGVVRVISNVEKDRLVEALTEAGETATTAERYAGGRGACGAPDIPLPGPGALGRTAFTLRVQTGCEERCAYCIIPSTRGRSRSTPSAGLVDEIQRIEAAGYLEVTLTGVHLGAYGRDLIPERSLASLLETLLGATDRVVFRLGSLEPMDCPPALVRLATSTPRLAPSFHLPLQHASDVVLAAMRRPYTRALYAATVDDIRARLPHASITADVIVGFPGESDDDVETLVRYLETSPLTQLHVFPYSDRPGTEASEMPAKVHGALIRARGARVRAVGEQLATKFRATQNGRECTALTIEDGSVATTDNGLRVTLDQRCRRNERVQVRLALDDGRLIGRTLPGGREDDETTPGATL